MINFKRTPLYNSWVTMKQRCYNLRNHKWPAYGKRGIKVCPEWLSNFTAFEKWANEKGYRPGLTLDRENNNGDYTPNNCRWVTPKIQANNRRNSRLLTIEGETKSVAEWAEDSRSAVNQFTIYKRLNVGWVESAAVFLPAYSKPILKEGNIIRRDLLP